ncbi:hypothetical protein D3C76_426500 [compost metagenome]
MPGGGVQAPATEGQQAAGFGHHQVRRQHACAAQHGVDACQQFAGGEGLDQVVVGAHFQADDTVGFIVARGEHQYRGGLVFARAQLAAEHQAIVAGHHDVQHDQVHRRGFEEAAHLPAIGHDRGAQAVFLQVVAHQLAYLAVIVNDENVIDVLHGDLPLQVGGCRTVYRALARTPFALCIAVYLGCWRIHTDAKTGNCRGFVSLCIPTRSRYLAIYPRLFPTHAGYLASF